MHIEYILYAYTNGKKLKWVDRLLLLFVLNVASSYIYMCLHTQENSRK